MTVCPPMTFVFAFFKRFLLYENYIIYSLPGAVVCAAVGTMLVGSSVNRLLKVVLATPVVAALIVFGYFFYTNPCGNGSSGTRSSKSANLSFTAGARLTHPASPSSRCAPPAFASHLTSTTPRWSGSIRPATSSRHCDAPTRMECLSFSISACPGRHANTALRCGHFLPIGHFSKSLCFCEDSNQASTGSSRNISAIARRHSTLRPTGTTSADAEPGKHPRDARRSRRVRVDTDGSGRDLSGPAVAQRQASRQKKRFHPLSDQGEILNHRTRAASGHQISLWSIFPIRENLPQTSIPRPCALQTTEPFGNPMMRIWEKFSLTNRAYTFDKRGSCSTT